MAVPAVVAFALVVALAPDSDLALVVDDLGTTGAAALAAVACGRAGRATDHRLSARHRRGWRLIGIACGAWAAGNAVWAFYELALGRDAPFPSLADVGYLAFVPFAVAGVILLGPPFEREGSPRRMLDLAVTVVGLGGVGAILVLGPVAEGAGSALEAVLALAYPVGDLVMIALILSLVTRPQDRRPGLGPLLAGLLLFAVADVSFAYLTATEQYTSGAFPAWAWFTGFLAVALAAHASPRHAGPAPATPTLGHRWPADLVGHVPVAAVGALAVGQRVVDGRMTNATVGLILCVGVLNVLRHTATNHHLADLNLRLRERVDELHAERERTHLVIDEARDPYVEMDRDGIVTLWNGPSEAVFGWTRDQVVGRPITDIVPEDNREGSRRRLAAFVATGDASIWDEGVDVRYLRPDGTEVPIEIAAWHTGEGSGYRVHAFVWDISERVAEQALLEASEQRWQALVKHSSDITVVLDTEGNLTQSVPTVSQILGYVDGSFDGHHFAELLHPDDLERVSASFLEVATTPGLDRSDRFRLKRIDGTWAHVEGVLTNLVDVPAIGGLVCNLRDVSAQVAAENELRRQARRDPLTGLPNRNLFTDALARHFADEVPGEAALLLMDLDGFKDINDGLGHDVGDRLLVEIAHRLDRVTRREDVVARLGGDEFAVLLTRLPSVRMASDIADNLLALIREPVRLGEVTVEVGVSIGIADCPPGDAPLAVLQRADVAMYRAKRQGSGVAVYGSGDDEERRNSVKVAAELRQAIDRGHLVVHFQPKIELATGLVDSVEALVRWEHPQRGLIGPNEFIALAERTGLIRDLTDWVLEASLRQSATWRAEGLELPVAVNLSPRVLGQDDLVPGIRAALTRAGLPAGHLTLEVTESAFPENQRALTATLDEIAGLGVRLAVDDFGTGWSSLSKLKVLPVQELKIDRSFVSALTEDPRDLSIVRTIVDLGDALGLSVVAEGVETEAVRHLLADLGCPLAQGYLFSRPVPGHELTGWILERERTRRRGASPADEDRSRN